LSSGAMNLIEQVRTSCRAVAERATSVRINYDNIQHYAASLPVDQAISPELDPHIYHLDHGDGTVAYILILDTINFGSGYFPYLHKRPGMSGYFSIAASLTDFFKSQGPPTAEKLSQLSPGECMKILGQDPDNEIIRELMQLFAAALNELGKYLIANFSGDYIELLIPLRNAWSHCLRRCLSLTMLNPTTISTSTSTSGRN
jgi:hypothetical protein